MKNADPYKPDTYEGMTTHRPILFYPVPQQEDNQFQKTV